MYGLLSKRTAVTLLIFFILMSGVPISQGAISEEGTDALSSDAQRYRLATDEDLAMMMSLIGVRDPFTDYNFIVNDRGTGLAPPTAEEWELVLGSALLDSGADEYDVPTASNLDLSAEPFFPQVRNQGSEGSCAAFALTYYNYGYIEAKDNGWTQAKTGNDSQLLSPAWTYNKVNGASHEISGFTENGRLLQEIGAATWAAYPYVESDDEGFGTEAAWRSAPSHRISSYVSVYQPDPGEVVNIIKEQLGKNRPVSFAMDAYQYTPAFADGNYIMSAAEYNTAAYNHGQTIVGYDDAVTDDGDVGAFKVVNSWGSSWGQGGYYWVSFQAIKEMLGFPFIYIIDLEDYQPTLLATWQFSTAPSVDTKVEVGSGSSTAPTAKVNTYFVSGTSNRLPGFMALDVSTLYSKYLSGEKDYYLTLSDSTLSGTVSSFRLELYTPVYIAGSPTKILVTSSVVPKAVPGTVTGTISTVTTGDTTPPISKVQALPSYVRSDVVTLSVTSSDTGSGVDYLELYYRYNALGSYTKYAPSSNPTGKWTGSSISFNAGDAQEQGSYNFYSVAVDQAGNREAAPTSPDAWTTVDLEAPISSLALQGTLGLNGYFTSSVSATLTATDSGSGVGSITYRLNGGTWTTYTSAITISADGTTTLEFYATDLAGNQGALLSETIAIGPDTSEAMVYATTDIDTLSGWFNSTVMVTLTTTTEVEGFEIQYRLNGGEWALYTGALAITSEGENLLEWYGTNESGVKGSTYSRVLMLDLTAPECESYVNGTPVVEGWYTSSVNATLSSQDQGSGVSSLLFRLDGGEWQVYTEQVVFGEGRHLLEFYAVDLSGNSGAVVAVEFGIDALAPIISFAPLSVALENGTYLNQLSARLTAEDGGSGIRSISYRVGDMDWMLVEGDILLHGSGVYLIECQAIDLAGNQANFQISVEISPPTEAPGAVRALIAKVTDDGILLNWAPSESGMEERYLIYRSSDGVETLIAIITETSYLDQDVKEGARYDYRVVAMNLIGLGPSENIVDVGITSSSNSLSYLLYPLSILSIGLAILFLKRRYL